MLKIKFSGHNQIGGGIAPECLPVASGLYILQVRYEPHLSDKVCCSEASRFSVTNIWYAYGLQDRILLNYTRIENAHKVRK